jgi:hypothetical protein
MARLPEETNALVHRMKNLRRASSTLAKRVRQRRATSWLSPRKPNDDLLVISQETANFAR